MDIQNRQLLYKIVCSRDKRYDGRLYCGVKTTGVYCRPICPAKPQLKNITFYRSSAEAEKAGYRPCLRCRPDLVPYSVSWNGTAAVVGRALAMIARGEADEMPVDQFAQKLGISDRHLRRLFEEHLGVSPTEVAISKRLHLAKQLLVQSDLPITQVGFASGYRSVRQFNQAFKDRFKFSPSTVRRENKNLNQNSKLIYIELSVIAPYDWKQLSSFLSNHGAQGVESFIDGKYRRGFVIENTVGGIEVGFDSKKNQLTASISISNPIHLREVIEHIRDVFDARLNPHSHLNHFKTNNPISKFYRSELGIRIPGAWDSFETAICIILGQLVSIEQAKEKIRKLVLQFGTKNPEPIFKECPYIFPSPQVLANANYKDIGITRVREQAIQQLSKLVFEGQINLTRSCDIEKTKAQLLEIRGIGPWTAEMIAMRCLGDTNAFPSSDLIIKRALQYHKNEKGDWSPWNAYVTLALWKKYAATLTKKSKKTSFTEK